MLKLLNSPFVKRKKNSKGIITYIKLTFTNLKFIYLTRSKKNGLKNIKINKIVDEAEKP